MRAKITKRLVDDIKPAAKAIVVFDKDLPGFVLRVTPRGHRSYQLRYRMGGRATRLRTYTIGTHGPLTPDQARSLARTLLGDVERGRDPAAEKRAQAIERDRAATLGVVAADFLELHVAAKRKPRTVTEYKRTFQTLIFPHFGKRPLADVLPGEIERWHHGMRHKPYAGNRALALVSSLMTWAASRGYREGPNPCQFVERFTEKPRKRYLSPAEIASVGTAIRSLEADGQLTVFAAALVRALLLTGLRRDELRRLEWNRVDFHRGVITLEHEHGKTGARDVPLSAPMLELLAGLPRVERNPYVFPGRNPGQPIVNVTKAWRRVSTLAGIAHARVHDLRHSAASVAVAAGASLTLIGGLLGHKNQATTGRYAHLAESPVRATAEAVGKSVAAALAGKDAELVPFKR